MRGWFGRSRKRDPYDFHRDADKSSMPGRTNALPMDDAPIRHFRTIQRFRAGGNEEKVAFMERNSPLMARGLAVSMEQV